MLESIESAGISMKAVTDKLLQEGIEKFVEPYTKLLAVVERHEASRSGGAPLR
jgi:transaldolase